jgi:hypothetical protein
MRAAAVALSISIPLGAAAVAIAVILGPRTDVPPVAHAAPTVTVTATQTATHTATVTPTPTAKPKAAVSPAPKPKGTVELINFSTTGQYSDACVRIDVTIGNRSDTPVGTVSVRFTGSDPRDRDIDLGWRDLNAGLAPFAENTYTMKVCDDRMRGSEFGPGAVPKRIRWSWL